jgi:hypothetical protein
LRTPHGPLSDELRQRALDQRADRHDVLAALARQSQILDIEDAHVRAARQDRLERVGACTAFGTKSKATVTRGRPPPSPPPQLAARTQSSRRTSRRRARLTPKSANATTSDQRTPNAPGFVLERSQGGTSASLLRSEAASLNARESRSGRRAARR